MLSKEVKARIRKNKQLRFTPKKRMAVRRKRLADLFAKRLERHEANPDPSVQDMAEGVRQEHALRRRWEIEDRVYFNGWRRGHK